MALCPMRDSSIRFGTATTAGSPSERERIAVCDTAEPTSVTKPMMFRLSRSAVSLGAKS